VSDPIEVAMEEALMRQPGPFGIKSEFSRTDGGVSAQEIELSIGPSSP
jgi:hypothetical protein